MSTLTSDEDAMDDVRTYPNMKEEVEDIDESTQMHSSQMAILLDPPDRSSKSRAHFKLKRESPRQYLKKTFQVDGIEPPPSTNLQKRPRRSSSQLKMNAKITPSLHVEYLSNGKHFNEKDSEDDEDNLEDDSEDVLGVSNDDDDDYQWVERAGFHPYEMEDFERQVFAEYVDYEGDYVETRSHILALWKRDPTHYLSLEETLKGIKPRFHRDAEKIYRMLNIHGSINSGIFSGQQKKIEFGIRKKSKILILGAGAAGLAAGLQLQQFGFQVQILEARNRIGGRVHTIKMPDRSSIDFGASIITGLTGNPLTDLYEQVGARGHVIGDQANLYNRQTGELIDPKLDMLMDRKFNTLLEIASTRRTKEHSTDRPLGQILDSLASGLNQQERLVLEYFYSNLEYACASDLVNVSNNEWDQDDQYEYLGDHLMLQDGYISLLNPIAQSLDVVLETEINNIEYSKLGEQVTMRSKDGREFQGDIGLVTLPLGVLKKNWCQFLPPLLMEKQLAISRLGFGLLNKIVLSFEKAFWDLEVDWIGTVNFNLDHPDERSHTYFMWNMHKFVQKPILVALCAGKAAHAMELESDDQLISRALLILQNIYKLDHLPPLISHKISRWKAERYSEGAYSYIAVGATGQDYDTLAESVNDHLFFAGEATNRYHPATVAGAYESGIREAKKIYNAFLHHHEESNPSSLQQLSRTNSSKIAFRPDNLNMETEMRNETKKKYSQGHGEKKKATGRQQRRGIISQRLKLSSVEPLGSGNDTLKYKYDYLYEPQPQQRLSLQNSSVMMANNDTNAIQSDDLSVEIANSRPHLSNPSPTSLATSPRPPICTPVNLEPHPPSSTNESSQTYTSHPKPFHHSYQRRGNGYQQSSPRYTDTKLSNHSSSLPLSSYHAKLRPHATVDRSSPRMHHSHHHIEHGHHHSYPKNHVDRDERIISNEYDHSTYRSGRCSSYTRDDRDASLNMNRSNTTRHYQSNNRSDMNRYRQSSSISHHNERHSLNRLEYDHDVDSHLSRSHKSQYRSRNDTDSHHHPLIRRGGGASHRSSKTDSRHMP